MPVIPTSSFISGAWGTPSPKKRINWNMALNTDPFKIHNAH